MNDGKVKKGKAERTGIGFLVDCKSAVYFYRKQQRDGLVSW